MKRELFRRAVVAVVALAAASLLACPVPAADPGSPMTIIPDYHKLARGAASPAELFAILDTDASGQVDRTEWQIRKMAIFYMRDRNNDLQLAPDELPGLNRARLLEADLDEDGALSGYEFKRARFAQFDEADRNTDGAVSTQEFEAFAAAVRGPSVVSRSRTISPGASAWALRKRSTSRAPTASAQGVLDPVAGQSRYSGATCSCPPACQQASPDFGS